MNTHSEVGAADSSSSSFLSCVSTGRGFDGTRDDDASLDPVRQALHRQLVELREGRLTADAIAAVAIEKALAGDLAFWRVVERLTRDPRSAARRRRVPSRMRMLIALSLAVVDLMRDRATWEGTSTQLLCRVTPSPAPAGWPVEPRGFSVALRRVTPDLLRRGIVVRSPERGGGRSSDRRRSRLWRLETVTPTDGKERDPDELLAELYRIGRNGG